MLCETGSKLDSDTLVDYMDCSGNLCTEYFLKNPLKIGSFGKVVEIDETYLTRKKYNRGRVIEKQ